MTNISIKIILTSSFRLLTSKTVANANPGAASPFNAGPVWPRANGFNPGTPATPPAYGAAKGEVRVCINGALRTPGVPARIESVKKKW